MTETIYKVIIDHPYGLHEGVADSRTRKLKPVPLQILTELI
jgi:hypothetical protein